MILHFQFSIKYKVILPPPFINTPVAPLIVCLVIFNCLIASNAGYARCLFIFCVIVYNLYYCCYAKTSSSARRSKNVTAKCTENLSPPPCILYSLRRTLMHLFLFTNSAQRELVSICGQSIHNRN